jgi:hypothetical protein
VFRRTDRFTALWSGNDQVRHRTPHPLSRGGEHERIGADGHCSKALSGYFSFAKTRDGTNPLLSVGEAVLVAAMFSVLLGGATLWLSVEDAAVVVEDTLSVLGLAFLTALLGAFSASLKPRREPIPHW